VTLSRRTLLAAGATVPFLTGCGDSSPQKVAKKRIHYAHDHPDQFADLRLPRGHRVGTLVLLHGGYWLPGFGLDQLDPIADVMTRAGWVTWNVEYRRVGDGGDWPHPMTDVALAIDRLQDEGLATSVVLLGHSAGGQLAVWAASRNERTPGGPPKVRPRGAISLSGVLDLTTAAHESGSEDPVTAFVGGSPAAQPQRYALSDPTRLVPARSPVWAVHAKDDTVIPADQATSYVDRAVAASGRAELVTVPGDHFTLIDPTASSFPTIRKLIARAGA
jgi:acetyl esterase/lipase